MRPAICDGDVITVAPAASTLVPGRVVLYRRLDRLFAHRLVSAANGGDRLVLRGDAIADCDAPVSRTQVLGELVEVTPGDRRSGLRGVAEIAAGVLRRCRRFTCGG
jgi:hypothetical protein